MLETVCSEFKAYHYEIVAGLESDEEVALQQVVFDKHQKKTMGFIDRLADLLVKPQVSVPSSAFTNNWSVDRHLGFFAKSVQTIRREVEIPDFVDEPVLRSYLDEIRSLKGELQGLRKGILSLDGMGEHVQKALVSRQTYLNYMWPFYN